MRGTLIHNFSQSRSWSTVDLATLVTWSRDVGITALHHGVRTSLRCERCETAQANSDSIYGTKVQKMRTEVSGEGGVQ